MNEALLAAHVTEVRGVKVKSKDASWKEWTAHILSRDLIKNVFVVSRVV